MLNNEKNIQGEVIDHMDAKNSLMKVLVGPKEGWDGYVMRSVEVEKDGFSPKHMHDWPHINYVLEGNGVLFLEGKEQVISKGSIAYIPSNELHQFKNTGSEVLKFICIVPERGHTF